MEVAAGQVSELVQAAVGAHRRMWQSASRLADQITVRAEATDHDLAVTAAAPGAAGDPVIVRGPASAVLCWLLGRSAAAAGLTVTRARQPWTLPRLRPWA